MVTDDVSINKPGSRGCSGCGVCVLACPENCIHLDLNEDGYYVAQADPDRCINCGACQEVCYKYINELPSNFNDALAVYTAYHLDDAIRYHSSSGGVGTAIGMAAFELGYKVIGVCLDVDKRKVYHTVIDKVEDLYRIRGSKYAPSYTVEAFSELKKGGRYLVTGTPCQIGGLRRLLQLIPNADDIILVDFRCAGHPGYNLFHKYIDYLNSLNPSGIRSLNMRDKKKNWVLWGLRSEFNDGKEHYRNKFNDLYIFAFRTGQAIHQTCRTCDIYKNQSAADFRMEDAWFFTKKATEEDRRKGLSQVTIYSKKGEMLFEQATKYLSATREEIDLFGRKWVSFANDGNVMDLLRTDKSLPIIIREYKKGWSLKRRVKWRYYELTTSIFLQKIITLTPTILKKLGKLIFSKFISYSPYEDK